MSSIAASMPHGYHSPIPLTRKFAQGGGSALLGFSGANTMSAHAASATPAHIDLSSFDGIVGSIFGGGLTGPMQMAGAVLLFIFAGRCIARFAGLFVVAAIYFLHMQGVTFGEAASFLGDVGQRAGAAVQAFRTAQV